MAEIVEESITSPAVQETTEHYTVSTPEENVSDLDIDGIGSSDDELQRLSC